jgi:hypothetical protein
MSQPKTNQKVMVKQFLFDVSAATLNALNQLLVWCRVSRKLFHTKEPDDV